MRKNGSPAKPCVLSSLSSSCHFTGSGKSIQGQQRESGDAPYIPLHRTEDRGTHLYLLRGIQG